MQNLRGRFLIAAAIAILATLLVVWPSFFPSSHERVSDVSLPDAKHESAPAVETKSPTNVSPPSNLLNTVKAADFSEEEKAGFENKFKKDFKPVMEKWLSAYQGHVSFGIGDFTLEKFHSRIGRRIYTYTFMIDPDTTLVIRDSTDREPAKVDYLMSRKAAVAINRLPQAGFVPDVTLPVTREEIIRMVKADSGVEFKPNEVIIRPTAAATALNGGAFVNILPTGKDPNNALNYKIIMVVGADGKLVNYERDPSF